MHTASEIGIDDFPAKRSPDEQKRELVEYLKSL
jgi:hypothetical protein